MKFIKISILLLVILVSAFTVNHKFYISVTQIECVQKKQSVQIISRIFIDDLEGLLRNRYDRNVILTRDSEPKSANIYIETYFKEKIKSTGKTQTYLL